MNNIGIEIKKIQEAESLETSEGMMKPLIFGKNLGVIHFEILRSRQVLKYLLMPILQKVLYTA